MLKTMFKQTAKVLKEKLNKSRITQKIAKHPNYLAKAKEILTMVNDDLKISDTVENKLIPKVNKFEKALMAKFPELTKDDVTEIKQSIVGDFDTVKEAMLKELQDLNSKLQEENTKLKNKLSKFQSVDTENTDIEPTDISATNIINEKQENIQP